METECIVVNCQTNWNKIRCISSSNIEFWINYRFLNTLRPSTRPGSHLIFVFYQSLNYQGIGAEIFKSFEMKYYDCACHTNVMNHKMTSSTFTEICVLKTKFGCKIWFVGLQKGAVRAHFKLSSIIYLIDSII